MIIPFDADARRRYYALLDEVFDASVWSDGPKLRAFEEAFAAYTGLPARGVASGGAGLLAILDYVGVAGAEVVLPSNTSWATALAVRWAGGTPVYADCNVEDLCLSCDDLARRLTPRTKAVVVVHIGGHLAFDIERIAALCRARGVALVEDCAHAHGAWYRGQVAGSWGLAGAYSFYATKTMPLGEGGMVVSRDAAFLEWLAHYRNYGKRIMGAQVSYPLADGFHFRMSEFSAALGLVQLERLPAILAWKRELAARYDAVFERRVRFPEGMTSGYYKYVVFDYALRERTGCVFAAGDQCHAVEGADVDLPATAWVAAHHACAPIFHGWDGAHLDPPQLRRRLLGE